MGFGTQEHSIKPKGHSTPLRGEATRFKGTHLWVGMKQLNCKITKGCQVGNSHSLQARETFASGSWEATQKTRAPEHREGILGHMQNQQPFRPPKKLRAPETGKAEFA